MIPIENTTLSKRIDFLDAVKGFAIICIVLGHSVPSSSFSFNFVFSFHIPVFFVVSGYIFAVKQSVALDFKDIAYKNFRRLILPYFATALIIYVSGIIFFICREAAGYISTSYSIWDAGFFHYMKVVIHNNGPVMLQNGEKYLLSYCYGAGTEVKQLSSVIGEVGIYWFLPSLFLSNIIFYFFLKLSGKYSVIVQSLVIMVLTTAGYVIGRYLFLPWSLDVSLVSQIFFFGGYLMRQYKVLERKVPLLLLIVAAGIWALDLYMGGLNMNTRIYHNPFISIAGAAAASYLLMKSAYFLSGSAVFRRVPLSYIGQQSLVILCFHSLDKWNYLETVKSVNGYLAQNHYWIILTGFRLCYSLLIAEIIKRLPVFKSIYYPNTSRPTAKR